MSDPLNLIGRTISEKYEIEALVGEGGFAVVYRATHNVWKRPVAIKIFRVLSTLTTAARVNAIDNFVQEGAVLAELSERSAAICQARDIGTLEVNGQTMPYMVLEWLDGMSLDVVIDNEIQARWAPRDVAAVIELLEPAAEALALAHRRGIAHRDVKPANIFVIGDPRGEHVVKVLDFGIAKVVQDAQKEGGAFERTQGVVSSFTPAYGAPEQFSRAHGATGPWTDVFALALIAVELLTHRPPLDGDDLAQLGFASGDPNRRPTPRTFGVHVSDAVEQVFARALAVSPNDRYRSMGDFWDALRRAMQLRPLRSSDPQPHAPSTDPQGAPPMTVPLLDGATVSEPVPYRAPLPSGAPSSSSAHLKPTLLSSGGGQIMPPPHSGASPTSAQPRPGGKGAMIGLAAAAAVVVLGAAGFVALRKGAPPPTSAPAVESAAVADPTPPPEPTCPPDMVKIPEGKFFMGSDDKEDFEFERPAHQVTLGAFCMDRFEVSVEKYVACSDHGECKRASKFNEWKGITARERKVFDPLCNFNDPEGKAKHPINCVDWEQATQYCKAQGRRLPTEAEWEFATRGSDGRRFPWGDEVPTGGHLNACGTECLAWAKKNGQELTAMYKQDDGYANTAPVGSFPAGASPFGVQDVVGNVWEWVSDYYAPYTADAQVDPKGPSTGDERVIRGGAWNGSQPSWVRPTFRYHDDAAKRSYGIGFRCAGPLVTPDAG